MKKLLALLVLVPLLAAGCGDIPTAAPGQSPVPTPESYPPPTERGSVVTPTPRPTRTPTPSRTPLPTFPPPPAAVVVQPTPYAPGEGLPESLPNVIYAVQRPEQPVQLWLLRYEQGVLREELLFDLTEEVLEPQIGHGHSLIGYGWVSSLSACSDGTHAALTLWTSDGEAVFTLIVDTDGRVYLPLLPNGQGAGFLSWFPDGKKVLLGGQPGGYTWGVAAIDGTSFLPFPGHYIDDAIVSEDGTSVIFSTRLMQTSLNTINVDGSGLAPLALSPLQGSKRLFNLALSPSGRLVGFTWDRQMSDWGAGQIWIMNANGENLQPLGPEETLAFGLDWSPDEHIIAFARWENPEVTVLKTNPSALVSSLWLIDVESEQERPTLSSEGQYAHWSLQWLPDGSGLVFLSNRGGNANLWFVRPDGGGLQQLTRQGDLRWAAILGR